MKLRNSNFSLRLIGIGLLSVLPTLTFVFGQEGFAQTQATSGDCLMWINAATGKAVPPSDLVPKGAKLDADGKHATISGPISGTFATFFRNEDGSWSNSATGLPVPNSDLVPKGAELDVDGKHATITGPISGTLATFVRVPCPPPPASTAGAQPLPPTRSHSAVGWRNQGADLFLGYAYVHAPDESVRNLNGFNASLFYNFKPHVSIGGELTGVFGSNRTGTTVDTSLHRAVFLFGPQFNLYPNDKVRVFVHPLFGGVHDAFTTTFGTTSTSGSANAFAMAFGGGVDVNLNHHFAIRPIQFEVVPTRFGGRWQSSYLISTGLVIRFGVK